MTSYLDTICYICGTTFNNYYEETEGNFFEESSRKWCIEVLDDEDGNVLSDMESEERQKKQKYSKKLKNQKMEPFRAL